MLRIVSSTLSRGVSSSPVLATASAPGAASSSASLLARAALSPPLLSSHRHCSDGASSSAAAASADVLTARRRILGHWPSEGAQSTSFSKLTKLRKTGLMGQHMVNYYPQKTDIEKHPIYRKAMNDERLHDLDQRRKGIYGRLPPKKGEGKRAAAGKKK